MAAPSEIDPAVLAAALREVAGIDVDPSTEMGAMEASSHVGRLMRRKGSLRRLLDVMVRLATEASGARADTEEALGPVATSSEVFPDLLMAAPPIGSEEFEQYMDQLVRLEELRSSTRPTTARSTRAGG